MKYMTCLIVILSSLGLAQETETGNLDKCFEQVSIAYQQKDTVKAKALLAELNAMNSASYKVDLAELKMFALLEQYENATTKLLSLLENNAFDDYLIRNAHEINAVLALANNNADNPKSSGLIAKYLVEYYSNKAPSSNVFIKLAFLEQFQLLYKLHDNRYLSTDYNSQRILGRAFAACFKTKIYGDLKDENSTFIGKTQLAKICTIHYENAIKLAPSQYLRSQLANAWLTLAARSDFGVDSQLLRKQLSLINMEIKDHTAIEKQTALFASELKKAMRVGKQSSMLNEGTQDLIANSLVKEFTLFARVGIPELVLRDVLKDMWFFFDEGLPMYFIRQISEIRKLRNTLRWYLWYSIIQSLPNGFEQKVVNYQVEYFANKSLDFSNTPQVPDEYKVVLSKKISIWKDLFLRLKDNRFVPYYKQGYTPYIFGHCCLGLQKDRLKKVEHLLRMMNTVKDRGREKREYARMFEQMSRSAIIDLHMNYTCLDRPAVKFLPDDVIGRDSGTMNEYYIYTFFLPAR